MIAAEVVETQTVRLLFQLQDTDPTTGVTSNLNALGLAISNVFLTGSDDQPILTTGKAGWDNQAAGRVYLDPGDSDFWADKSPYRLRFQLTDNVNQIRYYPDAGRTFEIKVHKLRG